MKNISWKGWLIIILYAMSLIGTFITHGMLLTRYSTDNIDVVWTDKRVGISDTYKKHDVVYFDFEITNNSVCMLNSYSGEVKIVKKSNGNVLLTKTYSSIERIEKKGSKNFYIYLYDTSVDWGGVENFATIYETDFSDLELTYTITKADFTEPSLMFTFLKTVCPIPTYLLGCLLGGIIIIILICLIFKGSFAAGEVANGAKDIIVLIIKK